MIAMATGGTSVANAGSGMAGTQGRGRRAAAAAVLGGWLVTAGAAPAPRVWILSADTWAVPREAQTLLAMAPVTAAVRALLTDPQSRLTLVHPASEEGALWGRALRRAAAHRRAAGDGRDRDRAAHSLAIRFCRKEYAMSRVAAVQMASGPNVSANLIEAGRLIARAVKNHDAKLIVLPENFAIMGLSEQDKVKIREQDGKGPIQDFLANQAAKHGVWLVGGTIPIVAAADYKVRAAGLLMDNRGRRVVLYDKMHMFDVHSSETGENYAESQTIEAGDAIVVLDTPFGKLGLAVCYDLRFPELFRAMLGQGMEVLVVPSAFTAVTGMAHWEILVRARAIENLCYVVAAAQGGYHANGRETHGDSMIVDPWGLALDRLPRGSGVVSADIEPARLRSIRRNFPAIQHQRLQCRLPEGK